MLIFNLFARDQPISERKQGRWYNAHTERLREKKNIASSVLFNHVHTISNYNSRFSDLSVSHILFFITLFSFLHFNPFIIRVF